MVSLGGGVRGRALDGIEPILLRGIAIDTPARRERPGVADARSAGAQKVCVERQDHVGFFDGVLRRDVFAEGGPSAFSRVVVAERLPLDPLCRGVRLEKL